jgi:transcriptional regulator with PAS, ATPase and Fis domain
MPPDFEGHETRSLQPNRGLRVVGASLVVIEGPDRGAQLQLSRGLSTLGTGKVSTLKLTDPTVSRLHCEIELRPQAVLVRDCGSTNGTTIDGVKIHKAELGGGSLLRVGETTLRLQLSDEPTLLEVSAKDRFGSLVGGSLEMRRIYAILERAAPTDATVLIEGETGTGKDVVARSIHEASPRNRGPFVPIDCGAMPASLIESELFGYARGAFTGAERDRPGLFEEADGGTLFLDEIGEMPVALQPKLLRVLEGREIRRVGSTMARKINVRVIAATNRPLARSVNEGLFREDLYYRLAVVDLQLPPLRRRREDVVPLATHFLSQISGEKREFPPDFVSLLLGRDWPGNVRELRNFVERSLLLGLLDRDGQGGVTGATRELPGKEPTVPLHLPLKEARTAWVDSFERVYCCAMLRKTGGNVTHAAQEAGVSRRFLQRLIARLGIRPSEIGAGDQAFEEDE